MMLWWKQASGTHSPLKERISTVAQHPNSSPTSPGAGIEVLSCRLTRKSGSCVANSWIQLGDDVQILVKVMNSERGLFIATPASAYRSSTGKLCYAARVKLIGAGVKNAVEDLVLHAYRKLLDETGRNEPLPYPRRPKEPDRIDLALAEASEAMDSAKAGKVLLRHIQEILEAPDSEAEPWEKSKACSLLLKLTTLEQNRDLACIRAMGEIARAEIAAARAAPSQETGLTVDQAARNAKDALEAQTANAGAV